MAGAQEGTERIGRTDEIGPISLDAALAEFKPSSQAVNALKQLAWAGGELVNDTAAGFFIGLVHGDLIMKSQLRLPIKKLLVFMVSLVTVGTVCWTLIYPWLSRIQISIR